MRPLSPCRTPGGWVRRPRTCLFAPTLLLALLAPAAASAAVPGEPRQSTAEAAAAEPEHRVRDELTVTDTRLRDEPEPALSTPASVTVISRQEIERAGVDTVQELLAHEAGVVLYDQVGNDVSRTFDLRGFTSGTGTRVFLDGAPINDPRSNAVMLELVPVAALERVEITRGSTAALAGGGSEAGVINLWTRSGRAPGGRVTLAAGDFDTLRAGVEAWHAAGSTDLFVAGSLFETDGFRDNAGGELRRLAATVGRELGGGRRLQLSLADALSDFGAPGALTLAEYDRDPSLTPFNEPDFAEEGATQAALNFHGPLGESLTLSANLFYRDRASEILTTGRSAPIFGGFFLDSDAATAGSTVQVTHRWQARGRSNRLSAGVEWLDGETDARGFFTAPADPGRVDPAGLGSDNTADRRTLALFVQDTWSPAPKWSFTAGARLDEDRVGYAERVPDPANTAAREFSELSLRAGVNWSPTAALGLYLGYGEAFLPPTVEELFSFPLFGSNAELQPEDSRSWELGVRGRWGRDAHLDAALFRVDTRDEIVFDPDAPRGVFGANVNAGEARRQGLETSLRGSLGSRWRGFARLTLMEAEFRAGDNRGRELPLVPQERAAAGIEVTLPAGFELRAEALAVGEQVLDNDDSNSAPRLDDYRVLDARLTWSREGRGREGLVLFLDARNLLDEEYATRGIFAFDFTTFRNQIFLTPAPGRRLMAGLEWGL